VSTLEADEPTLDISTPEIRRPPLRHASPPKENLGPLASRP
jgi:hypothetical protein